MAQMGSVISLPQSKSFQKELEFSKTFFFNKNSLIGFFSTEPDDNFWT